MGILPLQIAARYLFAKKSHRAINIITVVAACGVSVITAALVCVLSVFNGFESLVGQLTSRFDPEIKIETTEGKFFHNADTFRTYLTQLPEVKAVSTTVEETVLIISSGRQVPARMKGVDSFYPQVCDIDSVLWNGEYKLRDEIVDYTILGVGLSQQVACRPGFLRPMSFYCPRREGKINLLNPEEAFQEAELYCSGQFAIQQAEYDDEMCITSIEVARHLLQDSTLCSAYELKLAPNTNIQKFKAKLQNEIAATNLPFSVKDRYEQQESSYKIVLVEKWITFLLALFILLIASFNIVGALSMLIIDKESEIQTLRYLGAQASMVRNIFVCEGALIVICGAFSGAILGIVLCWAQQTFGIIGLGDGSGMFVVDSYPVVLRLSDVCYTLLAVIAIGSLSVFYTTQRK